MRLTVVGSGTAVPDAERAAAGYYLEASGLKLLLDCGPGIVHHLARLKLDWQRITHLLITHFHNDHIGDVPALFFAWRWGMLPARTAPLSLLAPLGMSKKLEHMAEAMGEHVQTPGFDVAVEELGGEEERLVGDVVHIKTLRTPHTDESIAFRIDTPEGAVGYTGDTGYSEEVSVFLSRVDWLIMECSLPERYAMDTHLTPSRAARMARQANPGTLIITHVYPQLDSVALPDMLLRAGWTGETIIAHDGMVLNR